MMETAERTMMLFGKQISVSTIDTTLRLSSSYYTDIKTLAAVPKKITTDDQDSTYGCCMHECSQDSDITHNKSSIGKKRSPKRKQKDNIASSNDKGKQKMRRGKEVYMNPYINLSAEFLDIIGSPAKPFFLYRKQLEESDVKKNLNRLFVTGNKKTMEFLNEEERAAVEDDKKRGFDFMGIDGMGRKYKLHLNKWGSLDIIVINKEWNKIVVGNGAKRGDWVDLWGYRSDDGRFCLAINFSA
ncbi:hypothetical protein OROGR_032090 [Orobanche gracilis]